MVIGLPLLIAATVPFRGNIALSTELLLALSLVLAIAAIGGKVVAAVAAIVASLLVNWFYVVPYNTLTIAEVENVVALVVFIGVAVTVGTLVDVASKRASRRDERGSRPRHLLDRRPAWPRTPNHCRACLISSTRRSTSPACGSCAAKPRAW